MLSETPPNHPLTPPCENWERLIESSDVKKKSTTQKKSKLIPHIQYILSKSKIYDTQYLL